MTELIGLSLIVLLPIGVGVALQVLGALLLFIAFEMEMMFMYPWAVVYVAEERKGAHGDGNIPGDSVSWHPVRAGARASFGGIEFREAVTFLRLAYPL